jgi:hypothetical protein
MELYVVFIIVCYNNLRKYGVPLSDEKRKWLKHTLNFRVFTIICRPMEFPDPKEES